MEEQRQNHHPKPGLQTRVCAHRLKHAWRVTTLRGTIATISSKARISSK